MGKMFLRLDDASPKMDIEKWDRMEILLNKYNIKPIVGIIPDCKDPDMGFFLDDQEFWSKRVLKWKEKEWIFAMHGYQHIFHTDNGGVNPIHNRSEFAGLSLDAQCKKIRDGYRILKEHNIEPDVFFAPAHTFDKNTLIALYKETPIRIISDTIANDVYYKKPFYYIPQQSGKVRKLPFKTATFCYHPNMMVEKEFYELEKFIKKNTDKFNVPINMAKKKRKYSVIDLLLRKMYFFIRELRKRA